MTQKKDFFDKLRDFFEESDFLNKISFSVNKAGYPFIGIFIFVTLIVFSFSDFLGWLGTILSLWCVYFFRDPERITPIDKNFFISPADGKILKIFETNAPDVLSDNKKQKFIKVSIFMNVFNVHVNRIPMSGKIVWLKYVPGTFFNASLDKASENNERMIIKIEVSKNNYIYVVQIAGLIARRIKCDLNENQDVTVGERFGIIRFGSRVDLYLPLNSDVKVMEGQTAIGGETIIADIKSTSYSKK